MSFGIKEIGRNWVFLELKRTELMELDCESVSKSEIKELVCCECDPSTAAAEGLGLN